MKVFFDLDPAVYMSGFAAQSTQHSLVYTMTDGSIDEMWFTDGNEKLKFKRALPEECEILDEFAEVIAQDVSFARQCAKTTVESVLKEIKRHFKTNDLEVMMFLTGKDNFRDEIATIVPYKGNREDMVKPVHYQAVRDYFVDEWGAYVIDGIEADDEVSIRSWDMWRNSPDDYVIVTIDKDLDQIPGWHYDYKKHVFYDVDELDGELFFYAQVLAGDATDNIKGCYRIGLGKARKLVDEWFEEFEGQQDWRAHLWSNIVQTYSENMDKYPETAEHGLSAEEAALENARLVYMQHDRDELWTPS